MRHSVFLGLVMGVLVATSATAAEHVVLDDGTGDFPTIQAAIDAAAVGDTISLGDGTFVGAGNRDLDPAGKDLLIRSGSGNAAACVIDAQGTDVEPHRGFFFHAGETTATRLENFSITGGYHTGDGGAILCDTTSAPELVGLVLRGNVSETRGGGVALLMGSDATLSGCTLHGNEAPDGAHLAAIDSDVTVDTSILAAGVTGAATACEGTGAITLSCSDVFGNEGGDYTACLSGQEAVSDNFSLDPRFCPTAPDTLTLADNSPCADGEHPGGASCGTIGALETGGCGDVTVTFAISADQLGDLPTIQDAIDVALDGDTLALAAGTYTGTGNRDLDLDGKALVIRSAGDDPASVVLDVEGSSGEPHRGFHLHSGESAGAVVEALTITGGYASHGGAILVDSTSTPTLSRLVLRQNEASVEGGAIAVREGSTPTMTALTLHANVAPAGAALFCRASSPTPSELLITGSIGGDAVGAADGGMPVLGCSNLFGNQGGNWIGAVALQDTLAENLERDPRYCDAGSDDLTLAANSPCLDGQHPASGACGTIGALGSGCAAAFLTHLVDPDGSADFITIADAIAASLDGDTIELADTTYVGDGNRDLDPAGKNLTIRSQSGDPLACVIDVEGTGGDPHRAFFFHSGESASTLLENFTITGGHVLDEGGAIRCDSTSSPTLRGLVLRDNTAAAGGAVAALMGSNVTIENVTFHANDAASGAAILADASDLTVVQSILAGGVTGAAVACAGAPLGTIDLDCSDVFGNAGGDFVDCLAGLDGVDGNFSADPLFCAAPDTLTLALNSPCMDGNHPDEVACGLIGALPQTCGAIGVPTTYLVDPGGAGDFTTIADAITAAASGDTLALADTTFSGDGNRDLDPAGKNLTIRSQSGDPLACVVQVDGTDIDPHRAFLFQSGEDTSMVLENFTITGGYADDGGAISCLSGSTPTLRRLVLRGNTATLTGGAIAAGAGSKLQIERLTFSGNSAPSGSAIHVTDTVSVATSIIVDGLGGAPVATTADSIEVSCTNVHGNAGGDFVGDLAGLEGVDGNFSRDPRFCDAGASDFSLADNSPCLALNHPDEVDCGGDIGALGSGGCGDRSLTFLLAFDGSGDLPTIQEAIDVALDGDSLSLGAGTYVGDGNRDLDLDGRELVIRSELDDPASVVLDVEGSSGEPHRGFHFHSGESAGAVVEALTITGGYASHGGAILVDSTSTPTLSRLVLRQNEASVEGGAIAVREGSTPTMTALTLHANVAPAGAALFCRASSPTPSEVLITGSTGGDAVGAADGGMPVLGCSNLFGNQGGNWIGAVALQDTLAENLELDPRYCDAGSDDLTLAANSPCLDGQHPASGACGTIGALGNGCAAAFLTHLVDPDGSADFITIADAIAAALDGDTIELADTTYVGEGNRDLDPAGKNLTVRSQSGDPLACVIDVEGTGGDPHRAFSFHSGETAATLLENFTITGGHVLDEGGAIRCDSTSSPTLRGLVLRDNTAAAGGAVAALMGSNVTIENVTFHANDAASGAAILADASDLTVVQSILAGGVTGGAVACAGAPLGTIDLDCSDVFGNAGGDFVDCLAGLEGVDGNFSADPLFCAAPDTLTLALNSPCVDGNHPDEVACGPIGALPQTCGAIGVPTTYLVDPGGAGDFTTIADAITAAASGDTLALADATFTGDGNRDLDPAGKNLTIRSQSGDPLACVLDVGGTDIEPHRAFLFQTGEDSTTVLRDFTITGGYADDGGAISCLGGSAPTLRRLVLRGNTATTTGGAIAAGTDSKLAIEQLTFVGNAAPSGSALHVADTVSVATSILVDGLGGDPVVSTADSLAVTCTNVHGNAGGDFVGDLAGFEGVDGNFSRDPRFCDPGSGDFTLAGNSPCLDGNHPAMESCGDIGALGEGCAPVALTLLVDPGGGGDATTIAGAIAIASNGDVIELADATYVGDGNRDLDPGDKDLTIRSQSGDPLACVIDVGGTGGDPHRAFVFQSSAIDSTVLEDFTITGGHVLDDGGAILCDAGARPTLRRLVLRGNTADGKGGAVAARASADLVIERVTFHANVADSGSAVLADQSTPTITASIVAAGSGVAPVACRNGGDIDLDCSDVFGNTGGDFVDCLAPFDGIDGNFSADPLFCNVPGDTLTLAVNSPCADGEHPDEVACGPIGALGPDCGGVQFTYVIDPGGGGDFLTIADAITAAIPGDTLVLVDSTFTGAGNRDLDLGGKNLTIRSGSMNPLACVIDVEGSGGDPHRAFHFQTGEDSTTVLEGFTITGGHVPDDGGAILCENASTPTLRGLVLRGNHADLAGGAIAARLDCDLAIENVTFHANDAPSGSALLADDAAVTVDAAIIADGLGGEPVACVGTGAVDLDCTNVHGNAGGDFVGGTCLDGQNGVDGNFSLDPRFCDAASDTLTLADNSPCVDGQHPDGASCGTIGALGTGGCGNVVVTFALSADGMGDLPTIQDALDAAVDGDTLSLAAGTYTGDGNRDLDPGGKAVVIRSTSMAPDSVVVDVEGSSGEPHRGFVFQSGETASTVVEALTITGGYASAEGGAIRVDGASPTLRSLVLRQNEAAVEGGAVALLAGADPEMSGLTLHANTAPLGAAIFCRGSSPTPTLLLVTSSTGGNAIDAADGGAPLLDCANLFGNEGGNWIGAVVDQDSTAANFTADPLYCDADGDDLSLAQNSPCLPLNHPVGADCDDQIIGALGQGCGIIGPQAWHVFEDGSGDAPTIPAAIALASPGDSILVHDGLYTYTSQGAVGESMLEPFSGLLIRSVNGADACTIDAEGSGRHVSFENVDGTTTFEGFTLIGGMITGNGGAIRCSTSSPVLIDNVILGNQATNDGGGVYVDDDSSPVLRGNRLQGNQAGRYGGGMASFGGAPSLEGDRFVGNQAVLRGGGLYSVVSSVAADSVAFVSNSTPLEYGGGLYVFSETGPSSSVYTACEFTGNSAFYGGAVYARGAALMGSTLDFVDCLFDANTASFQGGAMSLYNESDAAITGCTFHDNGATEGGHIHALGNSDPVIHRSILAFASSGGGLTCGLSEEDAMGGEEADVPAVSCTDLFGNVGGDGICGSDDGGNFELDPRFLNPDLGNFTLLGSSPCLPDNHPDGDESCDLIGAFGLAPASPLVLEISDVDNDQGRVVRIRWQQSLYDSPEYTPTITGYEIYRRQDAFVAREAGPATPTGISLTAIETATSKPGSRAMSPSVGSTLTTTSTTRPSATGTSTTRPTSTIRPAADPDGPPAPRLDGWDYVSTVPAHGEEIYQVLAPTLCDSTIADGPCMSHFFVRAATDDPLTFFDSPPDSGYSVDNLAPAPPAGLVFAGPAILEWEPAEEEDFDYHDVWGSDVPELDGTAVLIGSTSDPTFDVSGNAYDFFHVTTLDFAGNTSEESTIGASVSAPADAPLPTVFALGRARPNPFAAGTVIGFDVPAPGGRVELTVYDVTGRRVRTLVSRVTEAGRHQVVWDRRDGAGRVTAAGVYFLRFEGGDVRTVRRVVALR